LGSLPLGLPTGIEVRDIGQLLVERLLAIVDDCRHFDAHYGVQVARLARCALHAAAGKAELLTHERFPPHGRVYFAGADVAPHDAGWIEGALLSRAAAAAGAQAAATS